MNKRMKNERETMTYNEFREQVRNTFINYLPEEYKDIEVVISTVRKVNQTLDRLRLVFGEKSNSPVFYVNDMYKTFLETGDLQGVISDTVQKIIDSAFLLPSNFDIKQLAPEKVKEKLVFRLINTERNREMLKDMPHREIMDLSLVYCYLIDDIADLSGTIWIRNHFAHYLGMDEQALYEVAVENTRKILPPQVMTTPRILAAYKENSDCPEEVDELLAAITGNGTFMYVITNSRLSYGAVNLLYSDLLDDICRESGKNLYILPSSLHEIIVLPDDESEDVDVHFLKALVEETNQNDLPPEEVLSDNVYYYDGKSLKQVSLTDFRQNDVKTLHGIEAEYVAHFVESEQQRLLNEAAKARQRELPKHVVIILDNDNDIQKFNESTKLNVKKKCIAYLHLGEWMTQELDKLKHFKEIGYIPVRLAAEQVAKSFTVSWHADGYCGTFRYMVVADSIDEAKEIWNNFVDGNEDIEYSWRKAERGVKNHYGGYITWRENGNCDKEKGCYKMEFDAWDTESDHLRD